MQTKEEPVTPTKVRNKPQKDSSIKRLSPERGRRMLLSPLKKFSSLRLVSPIDSDQELNDLEVASVLAEGSSGDTHNTSPTKVRRHETPVRPATVMTNLQRGNVQTTTPIFHTLTIHQMAAQGELVQLQQELADGADINKLDESGLTAFHWACANGQFSTVDFLVQSNADTTVVGNHGENGLLLASCYGYTDILKYLLKLGADVNFTDETGSTALMYAAFNNHTSGIKLLLDYGADITAQNEDNYTALDLAVGQGHKAVQQTIERHMINLLCDNVT